MSSTRAASDEELARSMLRVIVGFLSAVVIAGLLLIVFSSFFAGL
jgi:hypothetical protein